MDLKEIGQALAKYGLPLLGAALPVPGGAAIGQALANAIGTDDPGQIPAILGASADALQKAREFELTHQETILRITADAEIASNKAVTDRWSADMASDNTLSKMIRPMTLIYILTLYALFALLSAFGIKVESQYVILLGEWGKMVMAAYFVGRSVVQGIQVYQQNK